MKRSSKKSKPAVRRRRLASRPARAKRGGDVVPSIMQAAAMERIGAPEVRDLEVLPVPQPGPTQVLIALEGAGIVICVLQLRHGSLWPGKNPSFPVVLGS